MLKINEEISIPLSDLEFTFVRSSGPGGQNVNKVSSKAVLRWNPGANAEILKPEVLQRLMKLYPAQWTKEGELVISSQRTRDAPKNREDCLEKLRNMILKALHVPKPRVPTKPTRGSIKRRLESKAKNSFKKQGRRKVDES